MNFWRFKIFSYFTLLFLSSVIVQAQIDRDDSIYVLPVETRIQVRMDNEINSGVASVNDTFTAVLAEPIRVRDKVVAPLGTVVVGRIIKVTRASIGGENGTLEVVFETLRFESGEKRDIEAVLLKELQAKSSTAFKALAILGGTAIGGLLGAVSQTDNGALIGAGIGAGAGTGVALLRRGQDVRIRANQKFEIRLTKRVTLPVQDF